MVRDRVALRGARGVATFVQGSATFAIVASNADDGVQLIDVSDPHAPVAAGSAWDSQWAGSIFFYV